MAEQLYSVEVKNKYWCVKAVTNDREKAHKIKNNLMNEKIRDYYKARVVRVYRNTPIVRLYFMMGNKLW